MITVQELRGKRWSREAVLKRVRRGSYYVDDLRILAKLQIKAGAEALFGLWLRQVGEKDWRWYISPTAEVSAIVSQRRAHILGPICQYISPDNQPGGDTSPDLRRHVMLYLIPTLASNCSLKDHTLVEVLLSWISRGTDPPLQAAASWALGHCDGPQVVSELLLCLSDDRLLTRDFYRNAAESAVAWLRLHQVRGSDSMRLVKRLVELATTSTSDWPLPRLVACNSLANLLSNWSKYDSPDPSILSLIIDGLRRVITDYEEGEDKIEVMIVENAWRACINLVVSIKEHNQEPTQEAVRLLCLGLQNPSQAVRSLVADVFVKHQLEVPNSWGG